MNDIFISYREDDAKGWAIIVRDALARSFGEEHVFLDKDALRAGSWQDQIDAALSRSAVVLVVMGKRWLGATDAQGRRRLDQEDDVHRREIEAALARPAVTVIPLRVEGAPMPDRGSLPRPLWPLLALQARALSDGAAQRAVDLELLVGDIERASGLKARRPSRGGAAAAWLGGLGHGLRTLLWTFVALLAVVTAFDLAGARLGPLEVLVLLLVLLAVVLALTAWRRRRAMARSVRPPA